MYGKYVLTIWLKIPYIPNPLPSHDLGRTEVPDNKSTFGKLLTYLKIVWQLCYYAHIYFHILSSQNSQSYIRDDPEDVCFTNYQLPCIKPNPLPSHDLGRTEVPDNKSTFGKLLTYLKIVWQLCYYAHIYFHILSSQNSQSYIRDDPEDVCFTNYQLPCIKLSVLVSSIMG